MNIRRVIRGLALTVLCSTLVYAALVIASDGAAVARALRDFNLTTLAWMLLLGLGCYVVRSLRWGALMRLMGYPVTVVDSFYLHFSGQTMSVSPGRIGEVLKPWLARETAGMPMSRGLPLVFAERVADLIAVSLLSLGGLTAIGGSAWVLVAALALIGCAVWIAGSAWFHGLALRVVGKQSWARKHWSSAAAISGTIRVSLNWKALSWSVAASTLAWGLEGVGFMLCLQELGLADLGVGAAISVYAVSTVAGALTFLPGGIGLTEASMAGILLALGMRASGASAATLVTRIATLWWAVLLGWVVLLSRPSVYRRLFSEVPDREAVVHP